MRGVLGHSGVLLACLMGLLASYTRAGSRDMALPLLGQALGASEGLIGFSLTVIFIANVAVLYAAGTLADRYGSKAVIVPSWIVTALGLALMALAPAYGWLLFGSGIYGLAAGVGNPVPAVYIANAVEAEAQGLGLGAFRTFNDIGLIIGPLVMGWTIERAGASSGVLFNAALVTLIAIAFYFLASRPSHEYQLASVAPSESKTGGD
jgi:MFS family permease